MFSVYRCHCYTNTRSHTLLHWTRSTHIHISAHGERKSSPFPTKMPTISFITVNTVVVHSVRVCYPHPHKGIHSVVSHSKSIAAAVAGQIYAANGNLNPFAFAFFFFFLGTQIIAISKWCFIFRNVDGFCHNVCLIPKYISVFHHIKCTVYVLVFVHGEESSLWMCVREKEQYNKSVTMNLLDSESDSDSNLSFISLGGWVKIRVSVCVCMIWSGRAVIATAAVVVVVPHYALFCSLCHSLCTCIKTTTQNDAINIPIK